jgi:hypothetical protein
VLVVQGGQDRITPPEVTGNRLPGLLRRARYVLISDGPHAIIWTHADEINQALLEVSSAACCRRGPFIKPSGHFIRPNGWRVVTGVRRASRLA